MTASAPERPHVRGRLGRRLGVLARPEARVIGAATFVNAIGSGLSSAIMPLYLTVVVGLSPTEMSIGLGAGSALGLVCAIPIGMLADRRGPRSLLVVLLALVGALVLWYPFIAFFWQFLLIATLAGGLDRGVATAANAVLAGAVENTARVEVRATLRVVLSIGIAIGAALASIPLAIGAPAAYRVALLLDSITFVIAALIYLRLPSATAPGPRRRPVPLSRVFHDARYVRTAVALAIMTIDVTVMSVALPLWIAGATSLPTTIYSMAVVVNTGLVFALQVPVARRIGTVAVASRAARLAGALLFIACLLFAVTGSLGPWLAALVLLLGVVSFALGHVTGASVLFSLGFGLADDGAQGAYQGVLGTCVGAAGAVGPLVATALPVQSGVAGWVVFGVDLPGGGPGSSIIGWIDRLRAGSRRRRDQLGDFFRVLTTIGW